MIHDTFFRTLLQSVGKNAGLLLCALFFSLACLLFTSVSASAKDNPKKDNPKYASFVMDSDTGLILYQRYADKSLHPASLTKVMTLMLLFDELDSGKISLSNRIPVSRKAAAAAPSKLGLKAGSTIQVNHAISALTTKSANDVALALAEFLGGSERDFARMMTRKARSLGMSKTTFRNASGLHHPQQVTTVRDMARMARTLINDYPHYYSYFSKKSFTYKGKTYRNHNHLMKSYKGMDGLKTGYIQASGFNLISSAVRNNRRIIGVVFGGRTSKSRNRHMAQLLDRGFAKLNEIRVASAKVPLPPRKPGILMAVASLNKLSPAAGREIQNQRLPLLNPLLENGKFKGLIGEGDYDSVMSQRIETGLLAIAALKGDPLPKYGKDSRIGRAQNSTSKNWAIQIGAFNSRMATDKILQDTLSKLPKRYAQVTPVIAPMKTNEGWLFRARLNGYSKEDAQQACAYLKACLPIAPQIR